MTEPVLEARHLRQTFASVAAVDDVSFSLGRGECLGIVGESGSGKSTIARILTRLSKGAQGSVLLLGEDITDWRGKQLRKAYRKMQMVFQTPAESFDPRQTLGSGIREGLLNFGMKQAEAKKKTEELLELCGLTPEFARRYPYQVSGGECQRAAIARALAPEPAVLICDEPTSALDVTVQKQILGLLADLKRRKNLSILLITHDLAVVQAFCDRVLVLCEGREAESGTPDEIIFSPKTAYTQKLIDSAL